MKASEIDKKFDDGEDITRYLDMSKARGPAQQQPRGSSRTGETLLNDEEPTE